MADWSGLPVDLLNLISIRLDCSIDIIRFRSVCSSWRSAAKPERPRFANPFPILEGDIISAESSSSSSSSANGFHLCRRTVFLIEPLEHHSGSNPDAWLIKAENVGGIMRLLTPLLRDQYYSLPDDFPRLLDLSKFRVRELGKEVVLRYLDGRINNLGNNLYLEKVVIKLFDSQEDIDFMLLTIHISGKLAAIRYGQNRWNVLPDMQSPYDDAILFKEQFYAVDNNGRTVMVDFSSLDLRDIASPVFGGDKKYLVESCGELLLVDMYLSNEGECEPSVEEFEICYVRERTVRFKVFKLDEEHKRWVKVKTLGDQLLFIGEDCTFSASVHDISSTFRGNCVFFADHSLFAGGNDGNGVFNMETGNIGPLESFPGHSKLFWPPPLWITQADDNEEQD